MKQLLCIICFILISCHLAAQAKSINKIDLITSSIDSNSFNLKKEVVDSSVSQNPFRVTYLFDSITNKLLRVEYEYFLPYRNTFYYYKNDQLIMAAVVDKTALLASETLITRAYFENDKCIFSTVKKNAWYNDPYVLNKDAKSYLFRFKIMHHVPL